MNPITEKTTEWNTGTTSNSHMAAATNDEKIRKSPWSKITNFKGLCMVRQMA